MKVAAPLILGATLAESFCVPHEQHQQIFKSSRSRCAFVTGFSLSAIIYGWDGEDEEQKGDSAQDPQPLYYSGFDTEVGASACPPEGIAVADTLSNDANRMGSFARLAAAFSPPERGIGIKDIERVEVTCVRENRIELEAMLCEHTGCVSLSVPIQFPQECSSGNSLDSGCVIQNLDDLDTRAESCLGNSNHDNSNALSNAGLDELTLLNEQVTFPSWWVAAEVDGGLTGDCDSIKSLLNEDEFHSDIAALAQDNLNRQSGSDYHVHMAKVAAIGPSGICLKVGAIQSTFPGRGLQYLDVVYPFSGGPVHDAEALRAVVLGVIAAI